MAAQSIFQSLYLHHLLVNTQELLLLLPQTSHSQNAVLTLFAVVCTIILPPRML